MRFCQMVTWLMLRGDFVRVLMQGGGIVAAIILVVSSGLMIAQCSNVDPSLVTTPTLNLAVTPRVISISVPSIEPTAPSLLAAAPQKLPTTLPASPMPTPSLPFFEGPFVIGHSAGGRELYAYRLGVGPSARAIIGGLHGGYESNTVRLVNQALEYLRASTTTIPMSVTLYVVPLANPDGLARGTDAIYGRMNANDVDLNRNWDYHWQMTATHGSRPVSAGTIAFSEPETAALRDLILTREIETVIFYHSSLGKILPAAEVTKTATIELAKMMAQVTGYPYSPEGVPGQVTTGDAIDWLSTQGITAIEIELANHQDIEWERNRRGILAFMNWAIPGRTPTSPR